jgi:hypothetical protein
MKAKPQGLFPAVHDALRQWHGGGSADPLWQEMLVVQRRVGEGGAAELDLAIREVLREGLDELTAQGGSEAAQILQIRFLDGMTAGATANRLNLTEDVVYKRQRTAIEELADIVWQMEGELRAERAARIVDRLEIREPSRLFGLEDKMARLVARLKKPEPPWLVALTGIGGIGKTSLADAAVRRLAPDLDFVDVAWVSARQDRFTLWNGLEEGAGTPALTFDALLRAIVEQFGFEDLARLPVTEKRAGLRDRFKARAYLVVVDNLETAADYQALVPDLQDLVHPTRFLLTSRRRLHGYPGVYNLDLDELSETDSLGLIRHQAQAWGLADVTAAADEVLRPLYQAAGGNPLALKLLTGQLHSLSLDQVVTALRQARGRSVADLYRFVYWRSWQLLGEEAKRVLAIMPLVAESGGGLDQIVALSQVDPGSVLDVLKQLVNLCLVNVGGSVEARRYSIHRLTETFLLEEVLKWQKPG